MRDNKLKVWNYLIISLLVATAFLACENIFISNLLGGSEDIKTYNVNFDKNHNDTANWADAFPYIKSVTAPDTSIDRLPNPPTRLNYLFTGWNTNADGTGSPFNEASIVTENITVFARWVAVPPGAHDLLGGYVVTFDRNNRTIGSTDAYPSSIIIIPPEETITALPVEPSRPHHVFMGWNFASDGSGAFFDENSVITIHTVVYALWEPLPVGSSVVVFDSNNNDTGSTNAVPQSIIITPPATNVGTLPEPPTRPNYVFAGWNRGPDGSGANFLSTTNVTANIIVFAMWEEIFTHTVTFDKNHEDPTGWTEADPATKDVISPATNVGTLPSLPTRSGYVFNGWNTMPNGSGAAFITTTTVTENITVYAQWKEIYTVTFNKNHVDTTGWTEANPATKPAVFPATTIDELPAPPTRSGYVFNGWNMAPNGSGAVFTVLTNVTEHITVYAQWKEIYTVTFNKNHVDTTGWTEANPATKLAVFPATTIDELPAPPTRSGYVFNGWNTAPNGSGAAFTVLTNVTANITVYAQWLAAYTVTFSKNHNDVTGWTDASPSTKQVITPATTIDALPIPPTRSYAYHFTGWNTSPNGSGSAFTEFTTISQSITVYAQWFERGTGTSTDPYRIYTAEDLAYIAERVNEGDEDYNSLHYLLMNDIDLSDYGEGSDFNDGKGWIPIGNTVFDNAQWRFIINPFKGAFDGGNNKITGLYINGYHWPPIRDTGLFGYVESGTIKNLGIENVNINVNFSDHPIIDATIGGIAGYVNNSILENCYTIGNVRASNHYDIYVGGVAGSVEGNSTLEYCYSTGNVGSVNYWGNSIAGGVAGRVDGNITLENCYSLSSINAYSDNGDYSIAGGVAGRIGGNITLENCYSTGNINAYSSYLNVNTFAGGIAGIMSGSTLENCYSTGNVSSSGEFSGVGGIAGSVSNSTLENCHSTGNVSSNNGSSGGVAGTVLNSTLKNCYSTGDVSCSDHMMYGVSAGGVAGVVGSSTLENCYSTGDIIFSSSERSSAGGIAGSVSNSTLEKCYYTGNIINNFYLQGNSNFGGIAGSVVGNSAINNCAALSQSISINSWDDYGILGRIVGQLTGTNTTLSGNLAFGGMTDPGDIKFGEIANNASDKNGANIGKVAINADGTIGGLFTSSGGWTTTPGRLPGFGQTHEMPEHLRE
ncbi:MAG: InlB B-repeat-containing protein [Treponema sp.]|nr:InlB B-repeat-containing protein [Treponema sp.]